MNSTKDLRELALDVLDADELFRLGLRASATGDGGGALAYLKLAAERTPAAAKVHWSLAAEYAALQMPDRAAEHFARTLALEPTQTVARFQYGLLLLTTGKQDKAQSVWEPLDALEPTDALRRFKNGLLHMVRDEFDAALTLIRAAAADGQVEPALRNDMLMTIGRIEAAVVGSGSVVRAMDSLAIDDAATAKEQSDVSLQSHLAFSAYSGGGTGGRH